MSSPGSHDSFSFYIDESSPVGPEQPETVQNFVSVFGTVAKKLMRKWLATQTMNFNSQLEAGIRFFDLRISTKPRDPDNELFFAHGLFSATVGREFCCFFSLCDEYLAVLAVAKRCLCSFIFWGRLGFGDGMSAQASQVPECMEFLLAKFGSTTFFAHKCNIQVYETQIIKMIR